MSILGIPKIVVPTREMFLQQVIAEGSYTELVKEAFLRAYDIVVKDIPGTSPPRKFIGTAYIAGALTGMPEDIKIRYGDSSNVCLESDIFGYAPNLFGTDPVKHPDVSDLEVRTIDYFWAVTMSDFHINWIHPIAANLIEQGWAEIYGKPSIYVVQEGIKLSRLIKGMKNVVMVITYKQHHQEAIEKLSEFLPQIKHFVNSHKGSKIEDFFIYLKGMPYIPPTVAKLNEGELELYPVSDFSVFDCRTGEIGVLTGHDWTDSGNRWARFADGKERVFTEKMFYKSSGPLAVLIPRHRSY